MKKESLLILSLAALVLAPGCLNNDCGSCGIFKCGEGKVSRSCCNGKSGKHDHDKRKVKGEHHKKKGNGYHKKEMKDQMEKGAQKEQQGMKVSRNGYKKSKNGK